MMKCPHCNEDIIIDKINCGIFRHAWFKNNFEQVNSHLSEKDCDELIKNKLVYGCCKPFKVIIINNILTVEICNYI